MLAADNLFAATYCAWTLCALLCTHVPLHRHAKVVSSASTFGHWYYPLPSRDHATLFGVLPVPRIGAKASAAVLGLLLSSLVYAVHGFLLASNSSSSSDTNTLAWRRPLFGAATALSLLYFAQARTHGLVHNKADTVPWVFACLAAAPDTHVCGTVRLLLGCVYLSSGILKLRLTGVKWVTGESLQRLVMQFMLELRQRKPNTLQRILLGSRTLATISQCLALGFELGFFPCVVVFAAAPSPLTTSLTMSICVAFFAFGCAFHTMVMLTMSIDFIRFWVPALLSVGVVPWITIQNGMMLNAETQQMRHLVPDLAALFAASWFPWVLTLVFAVAHARLHDGRQWPASSFDLYNHFYASDVIGYHGIDLQKKQSRSWQPLDLSVCSSSGFTRSFGLHYRKIQQRGEEGQRDLQAYLWDFLPTYVAAQGWGRDAFTGCRVVKLSIEYCRSTGTLLVHPDEPIEGLECSWAKY
jgi:sulfite exporter TauE/SafE